MASRPGPKRAQCPDVCVHHVHPIRILFFVHGDCTGIGPTGPILKGQDANFSKCKFSITTQEDSAGSAKDLPLWEIDKMMDQTLSDIQDITMPKCRRDVVEFHSVGQWGRIGVGTCCSAKKQARETMGKQIATSSGKHQC